MGKIPWGRKWQPIPVFLPGKSHGQRSLAGYSPWDCRELETTWQLSTWRIKVLCIRASNWKQKCQPIERLVQWEHLIACGKGHATECTKKADCLCLNPSSTRVAAVMTLGKLLDLSKPQFLHVLNGHKNSNYFIGLLWGLNKVDEWLVHKY